MALYKKPYGLIYNDDGSLCVTLREDDTPFAGAKSFAVEEGTTNLANNPTFTGTVGTTPTGWNADVQIAQDVFFGQTINVAELKCEAGNPYEDFGTLIDYSLNYDTEYTISFYMRGTIELEFSLSLSRGIASYEWIEKPPISLDWQRYVLKITTASSGTIYPFWWYIPNENDANVGEWVHIAYIQLEQKPFATSFVDGARPDGILRVLSDALVKSFSQTGVVFDAWFKRNKVVEASDKFRLFSCTESGGFNIEKYANYDIRLSINDGGSYKLVYLNNQTFLNDLNWHFVVFTYDATNKIAKVYIDGVMDVSATLLSGLYFNNSIRYQFAIGHEYPTGNLFNGLIAAPHIAEYNPNIWTDSYIQELYNAKKPFSLPPRMPIV
ncbi:LamG-like jellyroll fold domain-containing protein [Thermosipho globiformans]|uniref:LamG-like jellyroll fold domain-containing protein n=1 Tax=Thermosipho globiformans TaxID=380685 RepID=UPI000F8D53F5|nr:LamG-like jellyroll fold domain-containing protein [Thermosipho globiformans]